MLDQLNIQVENPVAVLDQEEAKKFLTGKAEDKYGELHLCCIVKLVCFYYLNPQACSLTSNWYHGIFIYLC